jgi:hypothetical protein
VKKGDLVLLLLQSLGDILLLLGRKNLFLASWAFERLHIMQHNAVKFAVKSNLNILYEAHWAK